MNRKVKVSSRIARFQRRSDIPDPTHVLENHSYFSCINLRSNSNAGTSDTRGTSAGDV
jgi:hypothetical protein